MTVKKAIIPCAGFGTRFLPLTKVVPKELLPIADLPSLSHIVEEAANSGIEEVLIVLSPQKMGIKKLFAPNRSLNKLLKSRGDKEAYALANKDYGVKIEYVVQREMNGNGMAVRLGKSFADGEPVAVLFGDDVIYTSDGEPVTKQLINAFERTGGASIIGCQRKPEEIARRCGVMMIDEAVDEKLTKINGIVEKPKAELPSNLVSLGRFVLSPEIFDAIDKAPQKDGEVYLTDAINLLAKVGKAYALDFDGRRYDIGNKVGYLEAVVEYALRDEKLHEPFKNFLDGIE